jgi:hypothetical protein
MAVGRQTRSSKFVATELVHAEANINARLPLMYAHMPGVEVINEPDLLGMMSGWPDPLFNSIYWAVFPPDGVEAQIDQVLGRFHSRGSLPMSRRRGGSLASPAGRLAWPSIWSV